MFKPLHFLKSCPIFDKLVLPRFSKYNGFLWVPWFLAKNLAFQDPPSLKFRTDVNYVLMLNCEFWTFQLDSVDFAEVNAQEFNYHCDKHFPKKAIVGTYSASARTLAEFPSATTNNWPGYSQVYFYHIFCFHLDKN